MKRNRASSGQGSAWEEFAGRIPQAYAAGNRPWRLPPREEVVVCGIAGIYRPDDRADGRRIVQSMTEALSHRGPDDYGYFQSSEIALGIARLRVIDLVTGHQPIASEDETIHVVANGEVYGFEVLRERLESQGHVFRSRSDVEVFVHLYEEFGDDMLEYVDGMFAFALWDDRRRRMVLGRDRFGIKPLFLTLPDEHGSFAFASELAPLRGVPSVSGNLDPLGIDAFFALSYIPQPLTAFAEIRKLPPATMLVAESGTVRTTRYWTLPTSRPVAAGTALAGLETSIRDAVRTTMRADVPIGAFLSGGLDSGTIAYFMALESRERIRTYSARFRETAFDEGPLACAVADSVGADHTEVWIEPGSALATPEIVERFGEPFADPAQLPTFVLAHAARRDVTVVLSGDGGDELLGGYDTYVASLLADRLRGLPGSVRHALARALASFAPSADMGGAWSRVRKLVSGLPFAPIERHLRWRLVFSPEDRRRLYAPEFRASLPVMAEGAVAAQWAALLEPRSGDLLTLLQHLDACTYLVDNNLAKADRMTMAHGLELRVPLLERAVVEAAHRLHPDQRVSGLHTKTGLRTLMRGRLPDAVLRMPKRGLRVPFAEWFRGALRQWVEATLAPARISRIPILDASAVSRLVGVHLAGKADMNRQLWSLICFTHWYERFVQ